MGQFYLTKIANAQNLRRGDVVTVAGATFGGGADLAVEVLDVLGTIAAVNTTAVSATISLYSFFANFAPYSALALLSVGDAIQIDGVTFSGATWATVATVGAGSFTISGATCDQAVSNKPLRVNKALLSKPANVAVSNASLSWQSAQFDALGTPAQGGGSASPSTFGGMSATQAYDLGTLKTAGRLRRHRTINWNDADVAVAATTVTLDLGSILPARARILGWIVTTSTAFAGGAVATIVLDLGVSANSTIASASSIHTVNTSGGATSPWSYGGQVLTAKITTSGANLSALTGGACEIEVFYEVSPLANVQATEQEKCTLSLRADKVSLVTSSGDKKLVSAFLDQSGLGNNITSASTASSPFYHPNAWNGRPGLLFDGVDDWMVSSAAIETILGTSRNDWAAVIAYLPTTSPTTSGTVYFNTKVFGDRGNSGGWVGLHLEGTKPHAYVYDTGNVTVDVPSQTTHVLGAPQLVTLRHTGGNLYIVRNGDAQQSAAAAAINAGVVNGVPPLGRLELSDPVYPFRGYLLALDIWAKNPPASWLADRVGAVNDFWNIY